MMNLLVDQRKVKAAARSMHQFCPRVVNIFSRDVEQPVLETATLYLYIKIAREVFGRKFCDNLCGQLRALLRSVDEHEAALRVARMVETAEAFRRVEQQLQPDAIDDERFRMLVRSAIRSMFAEAGLPGPDDEQLRDSFAQFEDTARRIKEHLTGIKRQNRFVMG